MKLSSIITSTIILVGLTLALIGGILFGTAARDHVDHDRPTEAKLDHVPELLNDAKEEKILCRDLAVRIYMTAVKDDNILVAEKAVDEYIKANRDSVNVEVGFLKGAPK